MREITKDDEIKQVDFHRPHLVILGAGASRAAFPNGDKNGHKLPLMQDFSEIVPVGKILDKTNINYKERNIEDVFTELYQKPELESVRLELEQIIFDYFSDLRLPDEVTIYDQLILSLRDKDVIATFNWDPFLIQAFRRNGRILGSKNLPSLFFLHGNVLSGYCEKDDVDGLIKTKCSHCGNEFQPTRLLYPVAEKNYNQQPAIKRAWDKVDQTLKDAFMVTVFGYGAPKSDAAALQLLNQPWSDSLLRELAEFEIVDIREETEILENWMNFIYSHHYEIHNSIYSSWIFKHPRRTGEAFHNQELEAIFIEDNPVPQGLTLAELQTWFIPLIEAEKKILNA